MLHQAGGLSRLIESLSLRDLRLLVTMHEQRNLTRAAEAIGMSQSSASYSLDKMREAFSDPLFVRESGGYEVTQLCNTVAELAEETLFRLSHSMEKGNGCPLETTRIFRVLSRSNFAYFDVLAEQFFKVFPNAKLELITNENADIGIELSDYIDVFVGNAYGLRAEFRCIETPKEYPVMMFDPAIIDPPTTAREFLKHSYVVPWSINSRFGKARSTIDLALESLGLPPRNVVFRSSDLRRCARIIKGTKLIYTGPSSFLPGDFEGLATAPIPFETEAYSVSFCWASRKEKEPLFRIFLDLMVRLWAEESASQGQKMKTQKQKPARVTPGKAV